MLAHEVEGVLTRWLWLTKSRLKTSKARILSRLTELSRLSTEEIGLGLRLHGGWLEWLSGSGGVCLRLGDGKTCEHTGRSCRLSCCIL